MRSSAHTTAFPLMSTASLVVVYGIVFHLLDRYDWGQPFVRFACLAALLTVVLLVRRSEAGENLAAPRSGTARVELLLAIGLTWFLAERSVYQVSGVFDRRPRCDVGYTTQDAARMLLLYGHNPYSSTTIAVLGDDRRYWGYKYGPMMIVGYAASAITRDLGIKLTNLGYLMISLACVYSLARGGSATLEARATAWFCCALFLLPNRVSYELFIQGVNDILPIALILVSLVAVGRRWWLIAGLAAGLSFSAKFSPGVFYALLFLRRDYLPRFVAGFAIGLLPFLPFLVWDPVSLLRNYLLFHMIKIPDTTSLYGISPGSLHFVFPLVQLTAMATIVAGSMRDTLSPSALAYRLLVLVTIVEATYKEVHGNHLLWIIPFAALHLGRNRHRFLPGVGRALTALGEGPEPVAPVGAP